MTVDGSELVGLPEDSESLKAVVRSLLQERDREKRRAEEQQRRADEHKLRAEQLHIEKLRLERELARYKKWYYGPRADGSSRPTKWPRCCSASPGNWTASRFTLKMFPPRRNRPNHCGA